MRLLVTLAVLAATFHTITHAIQPSAAPASSASLRDLQFGDINFLHTTDTHGWHAGHLREPSFSADWGDYISFASHLRTHLESEGRDLLLIDTGDRIEGNGLYDASKPRGKYTFPIFSQAPIDLLCSGNHELYKNSSAEDEYTKLVPKYADNYLASNLELVDPDTGKTTQLAPRYKTFITKNGLRILAFGFVFDFTRNDKNTIITPVEEAVKYPWFRTAITTADVDFILVIGHVALRSEEFEAVHHAIRAINPDIPIQFFGGHHHIRDYRIFDPLSHAIASGRFMETIGFQSISGLKPNSSNEGITFSRRYIDNNLYSLTHHSTTTTSTFNTALGIKTSQMISEARHVLNLDKIFGCAPHTYWMSRVPYPHKQSIYSLLTDHVFPDIINPYRQNKTRMVITNTGMIRFDMLEGAFVRDSAYIVSPFTSNLSFIPDVPYKLARQLLPILNGDETQISHRLLRTPFSKTFKFRLSDLLAPEQRARNENYRVMRSWSGSQHRLRDQEGTKDHSYERVPHDIVVDKNPDFQIAQPKLLRQTPEASARLRELSEQMSPGYTTHDDIGDDGDDTLHTRIESFDMPHCVQRLIPSQSSHIEPNAIIRSTTTSFHRSIGLLNLTSSIHSDNAEVVDLIFNEFLSPYLLQVLNVLPYIDAESYLDITDHEDYTDTPRNIKLPYEELSSCVSRGGCDDRLPSTKALKAHVVGERRTNAGERLEEDRKKGEAKASVRRYSMDDVSNYVPGETFTTLLAKWIGENWKENCENGKEEEWSAEL